MKTDSRLIVLLLLPFGMTAIQARAGEQTLSEARPGFFRWSAEKKSIKSFFRKKDRDAVNGLVHAPIRQLSLNSHGRKAGKEVLKRAFQFVGNARVSGTWVQLVHSKRGKLLYASGALLDMPPLHLLDEVQRMEQTTESMNARLSARVPQLRRASFVFPVRLEISVDRKSRIYRPFWIVEFIDEGETQAWRIQVDAREDVQQIEPIGVENFDGQAMVYPEGPGKSSLQNVTFSRMTGDGTLSNRFLHVFSALDPKAWSPDLLFRYAPDDLRFDEVQTYFYADQAFRWFRDVLNIETAQPLEIKVHVGDKGKSNAAFYFQKKVFLGSGDGITYRNLLKDPSVVIHETSHSFIDDLAGLPSQGDGGALNEGFADFFTACATDNPRIGEVSYIKGPYRRTLENDLKAYRDFSPGVYTNGSIVGATLWDLRKSLGIPKASRLALATLVRLGPGAKLDDFPKAMIHALEQTGTSDAQATMAILEARGWIPDRPINTR